jgi:subtilisin family serine protease
MSTIVLGPDEQYGRGRHRRAEVHRRRWVAMVTGGLVALVADLIAAPATATPSKSTGASAEGTLLVRFERSVDEETAGKAIHRAGSKAGAAVGRTGFVEVSTEGRPPDEVRRRLLESGVVDTVEPNRVRRASVAPTDTYYSKFQSSYLSDVGLPKAWDSVTGSDEMTLAVIDSGVVVGHPDLAGRLLAGRDVVNRDSDPADDNGHGTEVTGVVAAATNNRAGVAGATWRGRILPIKVLDAQNRAVDSDVAAGITWAVDQGADVINLSLAGPGASAVLQAAVNYATERNVVVVAAAGNLAPGQAAQPEYPAACDGVIAVGATDRSNNLASFSNTGSWVDLVAPGVDVFTAAPRTGTRPYVSVSGTSFASPLVAGAALLLRSADPAASAATIGDRLRSSARDLGPAGFDAKFGAGLLDVAGALRLGPVAGSGGVSRG